MPIIKSTYFLKILFEEALRQAFASTTTPEEYRYDPDENGPLCKIRIYRSFPRRNFNPPVIVINAEPGDASLQYLGKETVKDVFRMDNEEVQSDTLKLVPLLTIDSVVDGGSNPYVEGTNFTVDKKTGVFTWITPKPSKYYCTYTTFSYLNNYTFPAGKWVQSQVRVPVKITVYALSTTDRERIIDLIVLYVRHVFKDLFRPMAEYIDMRIGGETETTWDNQIVYTNTLTVDCWSAYAHFIDLSTFDLIKNIDIQSIISED